MTVSSYTIDVVLIIVISKFFAMHLHTSKACVRAAEVEEPGTLTRRARAFGCSLDLYEDGWRCLDRSGLCFQGLLKEWVWKE